MKFKESKLFCAICQPHYLPWIGYFEMIDRVDVFVFLDDVQFVKREWKNRNRIRKTSSNLDTIWITVPIQKDAQRELIKDALISNERDWIREHFQSIYHTYGKTSFFNKYSSSLREIAEKNSRESIAQLNMALIRFICKELGINTKLIKSSSLNVKGKKEEKLLNICKAIRADLYLANNATGDYVSANYFNKEGIQFVLQNYNHPEYKQIYKKKILPFLSHLSIIDLLFNYGPDSLNIIRRGRTLYNPLSSLLNG